MTSPPFVHTTSAGRLPFSTSSSAFLVCRRPDGGHSAGCEAVPPPGLARASLPVGAAESPCVAAVRLSSLEKCLFRSSAHLLIRSAVFSISSCLSCLYVLEIKPFLVASFLNVFCHSRGCPCLVSGFLCCARAFKFNQAPFVCFCFPFSKLFRLFQFFTFLYTFKSHLTNDCRKVSLGFHWNCTWMQILELVWGAVCPQAWQRL